MNRQLGRKILLVSLDNLIWILILVAIIVISSMTDTFLQPFNLVNLIPRVAAIGLLIIGQAFTMLTGNFDLSSESNVGFTAMIAGLLLASTVDGGLGLMWPYLVSHYYCPGCWFLRRSNQWVPGHEVKGE